MTEGFAAVPNWIIRDPSISRGAVSVFMALASRSGPGGIHPSQATLARELEVSERSVRRWLAELEERGLIQRVARRANSRGKGNGLPDGYTLHPNGKPQEGPAMGVRSVPKRPATGDVATGHSLQATPLIEEEPVKKNPGESDRTEELFEKFYEVYPRKVGKVDARKAFAKAARSTPAQYIVEGAARFAADPNLPEKQYIPHPSSWLNKGRWDDEPLPQRAEAAPQRGYVDDMEWAR
ncbi:helix-turn-helix domain-containing protein [Pseudoclavibacter sp. 8L]|uniref:helix-turn-helix domain-containing protein n=1 Tax=Pseudoclavibacter sp. 8L TaxID=2653162 RepID=UPI0012F065CF|nr:helix-turn-helix domain-containing protein [Pseudoclavibacter sp. 8L]VXB76093.1 conserved hypothetical protein [Pseudoclavibacter sp. 8L]